MQYFWIAMLVVAFLLLFWLERKWFGKPDTSRAAALGRRYRVMTPALLQETPDEELVDAVVSNLLAKSDEKEPYTVIPLLSQGRCAVYSVWLFLCELRHGTLEDFIKAPSAGFAALAADGLELFGCEQCAALLRQLLETADTVSAASFKDAVEKEEPMAVMIAYIRENPSEFCDQEA